MRLKQITRKTWMFWDELITVVKTVDGEFFFRITGLVKGDLIVSDYKWRSIADMREYFKRVDVHAMHEMTTKKKHLYSYDGSGELKEVPRITPKRYDQHT